MTDAPAEGPVERPASAPVSGPASAPVSGPAIDGPVAAGPHPRARFLAALALLLVAIVVELAGGAVVTAHPVGRDGRPGPAVLGRPGVAVLAHQGQVDTTELAQVASRGTRPGPSALAAQALIDGLLLMVIGAVVMPRLLPGRDLARRLRLGTFGVSLVLLLAAMAVGVAAIARLRYLAALYLSPPVGTLSYLLLYGSFPRAAGLVALAVLMSLKVGACLVLWRADPTARSRRGVGGLALTSVGATVVAAFGYALAGSGTAAITDAAAAAVVALAAVAWAGVLVSGTVRTLV